MALRVSPTRLAKDDSVPIDPDLLRQVLRGQRADLSKAAAVTLLGASDLPGRHRDFEELVLNEEEAPEIRHMAAWELARVRSPTAVASLVAAASEVQDQGVLANVFRGLGQAGGVEALETIKSERRRARGVAAAQARFASALISHRLGVAGGNLPAPSADRLMTLGRAEARPVRIERVTGERLLTALRSLDGQPLQGDFSDRVGHHLQCATLDWVLLLDRRLETGQGLQHIVKSKMLGGVVTRFNRAKDSYSTSLLMLLAPVGRTRRVRMHFYRPIGTPFFTGEIDVGGSAAKFSLRSVKGVGVFPIKIEGEFDSSGLRFTTAQAAAFIKEKRFPKRDPDSAVSDG